MSKENNNKYHKQMLVFNRNLLKNGQELNGNIIGESQQTCRSHVCYAFSLSDLEQNMDSLPSCVLKAHPPVKGIDYSIVKKWCEEESEILGDLHDCPNIVDTFGYTSHREICYLQMEYVPFPLSIIFSTAQNIQSWVRIAEDAGNALYCMEQKGVVNRDIKPGNIGIDLCGRIKLIDFTTASQKGKRYPEFINHTVEYGAPEATSRNATIKTDMYSLGMVLAEIALRAKNVSSDDVQKLFRSKKNKRKKVIDNLRKEYVREQLVSLIADTIKQRPSERTSPLELLEQIGHIKFVFGLEVTKIIVSPDLSRQYIQKRPNQKPVPI